VTDFCTDKDIRKLMGLVGREDLKDVGMKMHRCRLAGAGVIGWREDAHALADRWSKVGWDW
jgi:hypothetical protein